MHMARPQENPCAYAHRTITGLRGENMSKDKPGIALWMGVPAIQDRCTQRNPDNPDMVLSGIPGFSHVDICKEFEASYMYWGISDHIHPKECLYCRYWCGDREEKAQQKAKAFLARKNNPAKPVSLKQFNRFAEIDLVM